MLSIIICTYNREKYLGETLERLARCTNAGEWELVLVNNRSTDSTEQICTSFQQNHPELNIQYVIEDQQGLSYARNRGMKEAKGDWFVFLDDDAFVESDYLNQLQQYILTIPDMAAFGGRIYPLFEDGRQPDWLCHWNRSWLSALDKGAKITTFRGKEFPIGANMGFCRKLADQCGVFDTTLGRSGKNLIGGEEKDYFYRIKATGSQIYYLPKIAVQHCIPPSRTTYDYIRRLGDGVGRSEKMRTEHSGRVQRLASEAVKWCATIVLWCIYALSGRHACGDSLVLFRYYVTKGLV